MRILVLSNLYPPDFLGGYEIGCAQVVDALIAHGHEVRVLAASPRKPVATPPHVRRLFHFTDIYDPYIAQRNAQVTNHLEGAEARLVSAHNVHILGQEVDRFRPDVVYVSNIVGLGGLGLMGALDFLRVPWVWHLGDCIPLVLSWLWHRQNFEPGLMRAFSRIEGQYVVVTTRLLQEIESAGLRLGGDVEILPYWIQGERPPDRTEFYRPGRKLRVLSVGQIDRHKGVDILIEAAARLRDAGRDDFQVDFYGRASDHTFQCMIHKFGLEDRVRLCGVVSPERMAEVYHDYDVFAFPTWEREPFGLVPLEASARGCVPLISRTCGVAEFLVHGVHCLKAERTPEGFATALTHVLEGRVDLAPLARRASTMVWRDLHIDGYIAKLEPILARAARKSREGAGTTEEAYRLALLAEKLTQVLVQEAAVA